MSVWELFFEDVVSEASVLARVLNTGTFAGGEPCGEACGGVEELGKDEENAANGCCRGSTGMDKFFDSGSEFRRSVDEPDFP
jgi:hypothetical protein